MSVSNLLDDLPEVRGTLRERVVLGKTNWFGVGGEADVLFRPEDTEDLAHFITHCPPHIPRTVIGVGSNLLVRDGGIDGVVIRLGKYFTEIRIRDTMLEVGAGALSLQASKKACEFGLAGLEFLSGIPGTIGGALAMNAGAYGSETADFLVAAEAVSPEGKICRLEKDEIGYRYRANSLPEGWIFTKAFFKAEAGDHAVIAARMKDIQEKREATQPIRERTSGSTFKNPKDTDLRAWELIDQAGCRGLRFGGAQVSPKHCNFFINDDGATATELEALGEEVQRRVKETSGIDLEWEVKRIGRMKKEVQS